MNVRKVVVSMLCAVMMAAWNGCVKDTDILAADDNNDTGTVVGYVAFSIKTDATVTRADDNEYIDDDDNVFNKGVEDEYARSPRLDAHRAFFFDDSGNYFGSALLTAASDAIEGDHDTTHGGGYGKIEDTAYYTLVIRYEDTEAGNPTQVLIVLNGNPKFLSDLNTELKNASGAGALKTALQKLSDNSNLSDAIIYDGCLTMTNSIFVEDGGKVRSTAEIKEENICETLGEAKENPVTIYVERVAAKFTLSYDGKGLDEETIISPKVKKGNNYEDADLLQVVPANGSSAWEEGDRVFDPEANYILAKNMSWQIKIKGWGLNALEPETFLYKNLLEKADESYDNFSSDGKFYTGWNKPSYHRSYWAVDTHYNEGWYEQKTHKYPDQYRPASGIKTSYTDYDESKTEGVSLVYRTYNDIVTEGYSATKAKYSVENTFAYPEALEGYAPLRYGTHVILAAELLIDGLETENLCYAYHAYWEDPKDYMKYAYAKLCASYTKANMGRIRPWKDGVDVSGIQTPDKVIDNYLWYKDGNGDYKTITFDNLTDFFELGKAYAKGSDGELVMEPQDGAEIYVEVGSDEYELLDIDHLKSLIYTFTELAKDYSNGRMYYAIPIHHNNTAVELVQPDVESGTGHYQVGDFGVVRNHWYQVSINSIGHVGTPVDENEEIIPNDPESEEKNIAFEIEILPWRIKDTTVKY